MRQKRYEIGNSFSMKELDGSPMISGNTARYIRNNTMEKLRLKGLFHISVTRGGSDFTMGSVVRLESFGKILGTN